ncbi:hypothetical protein EC968_005162 [Mortierella alpina]|nr:hypothetical protein EC968_005162 [Mortierella alpina]
MKPQQVVPVRTNAPEFAEYDNSFSKNLVCLYEIKHERVTPENQTPDGTSSPTLDVVALAGLADLEGSTPTLDVATLESLDLNGGWSSADRHRRVVFLRKLPYQRHYRAWLSAEQEPQRAIKFAKRHLPVQDFLPIFICMARKVQKAPGQDYICWVENDEDIIPRYLAIVKPY